MTLNHLRNYSLGYLLAPNILFAMGWFRLHYSLPVVVCLVLLFFIQIKKGRQNDDQHISPASLLGLLIAAACWTFCTGTGSLSFQNDDHYAHNAKFFDLFNNAWPTYFVEKARYACYYFGFFLVPAAISKLLGHLSVPMLLAWAVLGYWLVLQWLFLFLKKQKILILFLLMLGGVGHLIKVAFYMIMTQYSFHIATFYVEIWSLFDQSQWVTNQLIPVLLVASLFVHDAFLNTRIEDSFFPITLCFLWAIFPSIIFVVLFTIVFIKNYWGDWQRLFAIPKLLPLICAGLAFLPTFIFLTSSENIPVNGFIWQFEPVGEILAEYFFGVIIDLALLFFLIKNLENVDNLIPRWFVLVTFALFCLISTYRVGHWNDWFVRSYIPLMYILLLMIVRSIYALYQHGQWNRSIYFNAVLIVFGLSMVIPASHIVRALGKNAVVAVLLPERSSFQPIPFDIYPNMYQALYNEASDPKEADQYLGKKDSFYARYLAREVRQF